MTDQRMQYIYMRLKMMSDVGELFDGNDHLNEYTHEENDKFLVACMDRLNAFIIAARDGASIEELEML